MALVVEDGTGVEDANTYIDLDYLVAYSTERAYVLPISEEDQEVLVLKAMDYLESKRNQFTGTKTNADQSLQWPRKDAFIDCVAIDDDFIPTELMKAQAQLCVEQQLGIKLYPNPLQSTTEGFVTQKTVGPLTKKFFSNKSSVANPRLPITIASVEIFLRPLMGCCSYMKTLRV